MLFFKAFHNKCTLYVQYLYHLCRRGDISNVAWSTITLSICEGGLKPLMEKGELSPEK
jgi:hypothetical protein